MKKILKYYLPLLIFLGALGILFLGNMLKNHIVILKYLAGEAKIINTKINAVVKENGIEQDHIKLFEDDGKIFIVFQKTETSSFGVLFIDKERTDIFTPSIGNCYEFLFSRYLIQADCGRAGVGFSRGKHESGQSKFESTKSQINFQYPTYNYDERYRQISRDRKFEIIFRGE